MYLQYFNREIYIVLGDFRIFAYNLAVYIVNHLVSFGYLLELLRLNEARDLGIHEKGSNYKTYMKINYCFVLV